MEKIKETNFLIISGETGSGKTTQVIFFFENKNENLQNKIKIVTSIFI